MLEEKINDFFLIVKQPVLKKVYSDSIIKTQWIQKFLKSNRVNNIQRVIYSHLSIFIADFKSLFIYYKFYNKIK